MRYFASAAILAAMFAAMAAVNIAHAHGGGKDAYGGHMEKATGLYHCHTSKTPEKAELCELVAKGKNADAAKLATRSEIDRLKAQLRSATAAGHRAQVDAEVVKRERDTALAANAKVRRDAKAMSDRAWSEANEVKNRYASMMADARRDRSDAAAERQEAAEVLADAKRRERGAGPSSSRTCRKTLSSLVLDGDTGWFSSSVSVDSDGRKALRTACME